ncbi:MAG: sulfatase-like hydrolase/transferase [Fibrobacter sp.]|nr:sulfatase-like hydrolase/transferase [Fibrobacter sp.]
MEKFKKIFESVRKNPFLSIAAVALALQSAMLVLFYSLPDPLGLSLTEMFSGKILWQVFMAVGAILVLTSIFAFLKKPRICILFFAFYFFIAIADYEVFRFSHQRLSYSFLRTYFHWSNIFDSTTLSTLGGDFLGSVLWISLLFLIVVGAVVFVVASVIREKRTKKPIAIPAGKRVPVTFLSVGLGLSLVPLILFLGGVRGVTEFPFKIDWRFTLGKHTLTAPILHIAAVETFEFVRDNYSITDELMSDLDSFLPSDFASLRRDAKEYPTYRNGATAEYKAKHPYNIVFIFGESFKGRIFNQMLTGDTTLAPNIWGLAHGKYSENGGTLWFKNAYSGGYPTVRGTTSTYMGFPSHPNRDVPSFYASNHFKGFPEYLTDYKRAYVTISNPIFDHTLPFVERFFGDNWKVPENIAIPHSDDSLGVDLAIETLGEMPKDSPWLLTFNTIATHIPFFSYPDDYAPKPDDAMVRYRTALRYTDDQLGRFLDVLSKREDFERTVIVLLGDHDTPVDSIDYKVPQPLGVATTRIFMGIFAADSNLINGFNVREDAASQLDVGPTIFDLANIREPNHFWGYDLLMQERPANQPTVFFSQNAYYLGFRDSVLTGGLENEEIYKGKNDIYELVNDTHSQDWKKKAVGASKVLRSILRNDNMQPKE